jgi:hypothetical protein
MSEELRQLTRLQKALGKAGIAANDVSRAFGKPTFPPNVDVRELAKSEERKFWRGVFTRLWPRS